MTTTTTNNNTSDSSTGGTRSSRRCGPRGCGQQADAPYGGPFSGRFAGPFAGPFGRQFAGPGGAWRHAPVNIEDTADAYILSLYAAGLDKRGFQVGAQGDVLRIRYTAPTPDDGVRTFTRRESPLGSFKREFALNARVQLDTISASYSDGVLTVRLPKTPDAMQPEQQVPVQ